MNLPTRFSCQSCGKVIEFERPLFCPFCGQKLDPAEDVVDDDPKLELYRWTRITPSVLWPFLGWCLLVLPVSWLWGRTGFVWLSGVFMLCVTFVLLGSLLQRPK